VPNIYGIRLVGGKVTLIPVVSSSGMTYTNMVSIPTEEHNRYMTYITNYPSSGADTFNAARPTLHTLQDIPRSPCPRCVIVISCTTDTQPLSHDRDCLQANLVLRGRAQDSHHLTGGYLPSYLIVSASLHKVNCIK
jgi:hypothetical protein